MNYRIVRHGGLWDLVVNGEKVGKSFHTRADAARVVAITKTILGLKG